MWKSPLQHSELNSSSSSLPPPSSSLHVSFSLHILLAFSNIFVCFLSCILPHVPSFPSLYPRSLLFFMLPLPVSISICTPLPFSLSLTGRHTHTQIILRLHAALATYCSRRSGTPLQPFNTTAFSLVTVGWEATLGLNQSVLSKQWLWFTHTHQHTDTCCVLQVIYRSHPCRFPLASTGISFSPGHWSMQQHGLLCTNQPMHYDHWNQKGKMIIILQKRGGV